MSRARPATQLLNFLLWSSLIGPLLVLGLLVASGEALSWLSTGDWLSKEERDLLMQDDFERECLEIDLPADCWRERNARCEAAGRPALCWTQEVLPEE
jgi:hypothetical protein